MSAPPSYWTTIGYLPFALRRRLIRPPVPTPLPEVWVVSPGGVGTTALIRHVARFRRVNAADDSDMLKHLPRPPRLSAGAATRILFVSGPEADICASLDRRGWMADQAANLGAPLAVLLRGQLQRHAFIRAVRRQRQAWQAPPQAPVLHLDYADLFESGPRIAAFLDIADPAFLQDFPRRRTRTTET